MYTDNINQIGKKNKKNNSSTILIIVLLIIIGVGLYLLYVQNNVENNNSNDVSNQIDNSQNKEEQPQKIDSPYLSYIANNDEEYNNFAYNIPLYAEPNTVKKEEFSKRLVLKTKDKEATIDIKEVWNLVADEEGEILIGDGNTYSTLKINNKEINIGDSSGCISEVIQVDENMFYVFIKQGGGSGAYHAYFFNYEGKKVYEIEGNFIEAEKNPGLYLTRDENQNVTSFIYYQNNCESKVDKHTLTYDYKTGSFVKHTKVLTNYDADGFIPKCKEK